MTQPTPTNPFPLPPQLPGGPTFDPTGLRYDRADLEQGPTANPLPAGVEGIPVGTRHPGRTVAVDTQPVCAEATELAAAARVQPAFNLRAMRERNAARHRRGAA